MAKIGVLTSTPSFHDNYGAILQAFALQLRLEKDGHDSFDILYRGGGEIVHTKKASPIARFKGIFLSGDSLSHALGVIKTKRARGVREAAFLGFQRKHVALSDEYVDYEGLKALAPSFDAFICGSDQVWNPRCHDGICDPGYFLQFACGVSRTIAYAPSFGVSVLPETCQRDLASFAGAIDYVSVRENSGRKLLADVGIDAPVVVDPTMLLSAEDYDKVAVRPDWVPERYVAVYKFGERGEYDRLIKATSRDLELPVVNIPAALDSAFKTRWDIGPAEFLGIIRDAELICTDSFHATVFSTIYRRPCVVFPRDVPGSKKSMNSRMEGLLARLGMQARYAATPDMWKQALDAPLDYVEAHKRLGNWRGESEAYLANALSGLGE